jgi:hypothetical protein
MWVTPKEIEVTGLMISLVSDAYHIAPCTILYGRVFLQSFLTGRTTRLRFNGATSTDINIEAGIPQGSPLSPILFMLYNAELLEIPKAPDLALGFIDDIAYGISRQTSQNNIERLQTILTKSNKWKEKHRAQFELSKYMLIYFTRNTRHDVTVSI